MNETTTPVAFLERLPHEATRAVVDTLGDEAPRALYRAFDEFNAEHFKGKLGAPLLFITQTASPRALGDYIGRDVHGLRSRIRLSPKVLDRGERFAMDVLLHEMVHAWQSEVDGDTEQGYRGHGPRFAAKCNEIGGKLGLPPVSEKGRHGMPDCAQWPICVRPEGYYPTPARKRSTSARRRTPAGQGTGGGAPARIEALTEALVEGIAIVEDLSPEQREAQGFDAWLALARELVASGR